MAFDLTRFKLFAAPNAFAQPVNAVATDPAALNLPPIASGKVKMRRLAEAIVASLVTAFTFIALVFGVAVGLSVAALGLAFFLAPVTTSLAAAAGLVFLGLCFRHHLTDKTKSLLKHP